MQRCGVLESEIAPRVPSGTRVIEPVDMQESIMMTCARFTRVCSVLCFFGYCYISVAIADTVMVNVDYETGGFTSGYTPGEVNARIDDNGGPSALDAFEMSTGVVREGTYSIRTKTEHNSAYRSFGSPPPVRVESSNLEHEPSQYGNNTHFLYEFSFYLDEATWASHTNPGVIIWQAKTTGSSPDAIFSLREEDGRLELRFRHVSGDSNQLNGITVVDEIPLAKWIDIRFEAKWERVDGGYLDVSYRNASDGEVNFTDTVVNGETYYTGRTMRGNGTGYFKWGQYRPSLSPEDSVDPKTRIVYHDAIRATEMVYTFEDWKADHAVAGQETTSDEDSDLVTLLEEFAFNMDPNLTDFHHLTTSLGTSGLPVGYLAEASGAPGEYCLHVEFLRRNDDRNLVYTVQFNSGLDAANWTDVTRAKTIVPISACWERVIVEDSVTTTTQNRRFGRVKLQYSPP